MNLTSKAILLSLVTLTAAQYGPGGRYGPGGGGGGGGDYNDDSFGGRGGFNFQDFMSQRQKVLIAHGVLASLAFVLLFPIGSIIIRLGSFRGLWIAHGLFQIFAYLIYIAAFGIGVWMINNIPVNLLDHYHPIIGIVVFVLLAFQPILGLVHHYRFKKLNRRTVWSYGHLWLGRIAITLGIINGGLGMLLATETGYFVPSQGQIIAYGVVAGFMWLAWVAAAIIGERKRARGLAARRKEAEVGTPRHEGKYAQYEGHQPYYGRNQ